MISGIVRPLSLRATGWGTPAAIADGHPWNARGTVLWQDSRGRFPGTNTHQTGALLSVSHRRSIIGMAPGPIKHKATAGALRAASEIEPNPALRQSVAEIIDRQAGLRDILELLENIISEAGDLIEGRSPELVVHARAAIRTYGDATARQAE
jgi:hypothetical protein